VELVKEVPGLWFEQRQVDQLAAVGGHRQVLEVVVVVSHLWLPVFLHHNHVLNADTKFSIMVIPWLVTNAHALLQLGLVYGVNGARTLMNVEVGADSVTGAVAVVQSSSPEVLAGKEVQV